MRPAPARVRNSNHTDHPSPPQWHAHAQGKSFIYNEFALGGGISECGDTPAKTREQAGRFPWLGGTATYNWNINPWKDPVISQYNRDWCGLG